MFAQIYGYFLEHGQEFLALLMEHLVLSLGALLFATLLGVPLAYLSYRYTRLRPLVMMITHGLRVVPSLGLLFLLVPLIGVGFYPALLALVFLGLPLIVANSLLGFLEVSPLLIEVGQGLGMKRQELLRELIFPLALPHILNGMKLTLVEVIASASLAAYIGAGGLGRLIFTGLGLYRYDLLVIGGTAVAALSFVAMLVVDKGIKGVMKHER